MKRMLFISHRIPYPPNKGDKIRSFFELKYFSSHYIVDLLSFVDEPGDIKYKSELDKICDKVYIYKIRKYISIIKSLIFFVLGHSLSEGYYHSRKIKKKVTSLINENKYEVIFCYSAQIAQYVIGVNSNIRIMDFVDVDSDKWRQYSSNHSFPLSLIYKIEAQRLLEYERKIAEEFSLTIFSTKNELEIFNQNSLTAKFLVVNNGVDYKYFKPSLNIKKENAIIFVGAMDYYPNIDAVKWFVNHVFYQICENRPDIKFYIVGSNPSMEVKKLGMENENVIVTGFVDDVRPFLVKSKMAVMPIRIARGIQNKVLEAMSMELPVIINEKLYKSLNGLDRSKVQIYKDSNHLKSIIIENIDNTNELEAMGKNLRSYVKDFYSWDKNLNDLYKEIQKI